MSPLHVSAILACVTAAACSASSAGPVGSAGSTGSAAQPAPLHGDWSCASVLTGVAAARTAPSPRAEVSTPPATGAAFSVHFTEAYTDASLPGVQVEACRSFDRSCEQPTTTVLADEYGLATLFVPGGLAAFDGYLKVSATGMADNYVWLAGRQAPYGSAYLSVPIYTSAALALTGELADLDVDAQHALVHVDALDCSGNPAMDVAVQVEGTEPGFATAYFVGGGDALSFAATTTDASGVAIVFRVTPGPLEIEGTLAGRAIDAAWTYAYRGAVTSFVVRPTAPPAAGDP